MIIQPLTITLFIAGAMLGSLATMLIHRLPKNEDIIYKRSYCHMCNKELAIIDLIPIISYLLNTGLCKKCDGIIGVSYLAVEVTMAVGLVIINWLFGLNLNGLAVAIMLFAMTVASMIDLKHLYIPDSMLALMIIADIVYVLNNDIPITTVITNITIMLVPIGMLYSAILKMKKQEPLGYGDFKLLGVIAVFFNFYTMTTFLMITGIYGIVFGILWKNKYHIEKFPFAPAISMAFFATMIIYSS